MKRTPIFAEITDLIKGPLDTYEDPSEFTTSTATTLSAFLTELDTKLLVLAPRFYLSLEEPNTYNSLNSMPQIPDTRMPIQKFLMGGEYRYFIRLMVSPSVGWGINSSYSITYKYWMPIVKGANYTKTILPRKGKLKEENWLVPHSTGYHALNYKEWLDYDKRPFPTNSIELSKAANDFLPISNYDAIDIISVVGQDGTEYEVNLSYEKVSSLLTQSIDEDIYTAIRINFIGPSPALNSKYVITYTRPALLKDIIFIDSNTPRNIYSNSYYPGVFDPRA